MDEIKERIVQMIHTNLNLDEKDIVENGQDLLSIGLDSLQFVNLAVAIEDEYGIEFMGSNLNIRTIVSLDNLVAIVGNMIDAKKGC